MRNLALIPARSQSKGLRDKNIKPLNGKPLMAYSIRAAILSGCFTTVHVSTDSERYAEIAREYHADVPFLRSAEASSDTASSWQVILETLQKYQELGQSYDTIALLQPTSPMRSAEDIREGYRLMKEHQAETVVSVCEMEHSPLWCNTLPEDGCMDSFLSGPPRTRQQLKAYYRLNGALYIMSVTSFLKKRILIYDKNCYAYRMPQSCSIDIDSEEDFRLVEFLMSNTTKERT